MNSVFSGWKNWRFWVLLIATLLLIASLFNPRLPFPQRFFRYVFVFDITQSMNVDDVFIEDEKVTRLALSKWAVRKTIERMPCGSEAGLAVFTEHRSYLLFAPVEVCGQFKELGYMVDRIDWTMAWRSRSEVAKGLIASLRIGESLAPPARIVFLSDGHEAPPIHPDLRQVPKPVDPEFRGAVIGVGGSKPQPIPRFDLSGKKLGYWRAEDIAQVDAYSSGRFGTGENMAGVDISDLTERLKNGTEHLSSLREPWLQQLADEADLDYERLNNASRTARFLTGQSFAQSKTVEGDARWIVAAVSFVLILLVYVIRPYR